MGEHGRAWASLWLEHVPSISHAIGPRHGHCTLICLDLVWSMLDMKIGTLIRKPLVWCQALEILPYRTLSGSK